MQFGRIGSSYELINPGDRVSRNSWLCPRFQRRIRRLALEVEPLEAPPTSFLRLTSGNRLAWNTVWNLIGNVTPMLIAIFCIPVLIRRLGTERFGILTLVWALIGYAAVFDLGLSRALTQLVAKTLGTDEQQEVSKLVWTSQILMLFLGF